MSTREGGEGEVWAVSVLHSGLVVLTGLDSARVGAWSAMHCGLRISFSTRAARARLSISHSRGSTWALPVLLSPWGVARCVYAVFTALAALVVLADLGDVAVVFC